jgi:hypothetical protein
MAGRGCATLSAYLVFSITVLSTSNIIFSIDRLIVQFTFMNLEAKLRQCL